LFHSVRSTLDSTFFPYTTLFRSEAEAFRKDLIAFRERLREAVLRMEAGSAPSDDFLKEINARLQQHPLRSALRRRNGGVVRETLDRKSTRLNSSHRTNSYAVFCL